jgi:hypothetical protein
VLVAVLAAACGGTPPGPAACEGIAVRGACWVAQDGVSISPERAERLMDVAAALWRPEVPFLPGWRIELTPRWVVVDGERYGGYTWASSRTIVVTSGSPDCFEGSAILHELGHAWGHGEDDPRMASAWPWILEAMHHSAWPGCEVEDEDHEDVGPREGVRTPP